MLSVILLLRYIFVILLLHVYIILIRVKTMNLRPRMTHPPLSLLSSNLRIQGTQPPSLALTVIGLIEVPGPGKSNSFPKLKINYLNNAVSDLPLLICYGNLFFRINLYHRQEQNDIIKVWPIEIARETDN